jgi:hypothetical protein
MNKIIAISLATLSVVTSHASYAYAKNTLKTGEQLQSGQSLASENGCFSFVMQGDGNLVLYAKGGAPIWNAGTTGKQGNVLIMQGDGNLVMYASGGQPVWNSQTQGSNATLIMQNDGNAVVYTGSSPLWDTKTGGRFCGTSASKNFPLRKFQFTELGDHRRMESTAILSSTGRLDVTTRIWTRKQWSGFTGGVVIRFLDQSGNVLGATGVHSWGVDGLRIPGVPSDRTSAWTDPVPPDLLNNTFGMEIVHTTNPKELESQIDRAIDITCGGVRRVMGETKYCPKQ